MGRFAFRLKIGQKGRGLEKLVNQLSVAVQSASEGEKSLITLRLCIKGVKTKPRLNVQCRGLRDRTPATKTFTFKVASHIGPL